MNTGNAVLCFFAVVEEATPFRRLVRRRSDLLIETTGMGSRRARTAASRALQQKRPSLVLTCGFAGGLNPALPRDTVVFSADDKFPLDEALRAAGAVRGRFECADRILVTAVEKAALWRRTGADAVDMESGAIRLVCREQGVPSATVRVISDAADEDLPLDFNRLASSDFEFKYARLARELARRPAKLPELFRFRRRLTEAANRLAAVLAELLLV